MTYLWNSSKQLGKFWIGYFSFLKMWVEFKKIEKRQHKKRFENSWKDRWLCLSDKTSTTSFDRHYVYHPAWAARILKKLNPPIHIDISSSLHFCSMLSAFIPVKFFDYRPAKVTLSGLETSNSDLTCLPFPTNSIHSLSCMHTVEHVGLGRYGDELDYNGDLKAMSELSRVLSLDGHLLFVVPVGRASKIQYNAHRIYRPEDIITHFKFNGLELIEFTLVPEHEKDGGLLVNPSQDIIDRQEYGCGCFLFRKIQVAR